MSFNGNSGALFLGTGLDLTVATPIDVGSGRITLGQQSQLHAPTLSIGAGTIFGEGLVDAAVTATGAALISAVHKIEITGPLTDSGDALTLQIYNAVGELQLDAASTAHSVDFYEYFSSGRGGILTLANQGNLTLATELTVDQNGIVNLAGANTALNVASGVTLDGGLIQGYGQVNATLTGSGTIVALGGTLALATAIGAASGLVFQIADGGASFLQIDGTVGADNIFTFLGASGGLGLGNDSGLNATISGLNVGIGSAKTNFIDIQNHTVAISSVSGQGTTSGTIVLSDGAVLTLTNINSTAWFVAAVDDGAGGTDIFLIDSLSWTGATSTSWTNGANWNPNGVPGSAADVVIGTTANSPTLDTSTTVNSIILNGSDTLTLANAPVLTVTNGIALLSAGGISGTGTVAANVTASGASSIAASGGTLEVAGSIADSGNALTLTIVGDADRLVLDVASNAQAVNFNGAGGTLELGGALTVGGPLAIGGGTLQLDGVFLSSAGGLSVGSGTIRGSGVVSPAVTATGAATIAASGGTLEFVQTVADSGSALQLVIVGGGDRLLLDAATAAHSVSFTGAGGTLELNAVGQLTVGDQIAVGSGTVKLNPGVAVLTASLITLSGGSIQGVGKINANLVGTGTVGAVGPFGGTLELVAPIAAASGPVFQIGSTSNILRVDGTVGAGNNFAFLGAAGELRLENDSGFDSTISGLNVGIGAARTNFVDIGHHTVTVTSVSGQGTASGTVTLSDGAVIHLTNINSTSWFVNAVADGRGGTNLFLSGSLQPPPNDFNGDGNSDILWRNNDGSVAVWIMDGTAAIAGQAGLADPSWHIRGTGDFNADGKSDILWQNDGGRVDLWELNGTSVIFSGQAGFADASWHIRATGEFNGDGMSDVLWQNDSGVVYIWMMAGSTVIDHLSGPVGTADASWHISGTGDFNFDHKSDILWRNDDGSVAIWEMYGTSAIALGLVGVADASWDISGTGDFNADGRSDILWRNDDGGVGIWLMNGASVLGTGHAGFADSSWHIRNTGDFNADGRSDILWQHNDGAVAVWQMDGATVIGTGQTGFADPSWHIVPADNTGAGAQSISMAFGFDDISAASGLVGGAADPTSGAAPASQTAGAMFLQMQDGSMPLFA